MTDFCSEHVAHSEHLVRLDARVEGLEDDSRELSRFTERITVLVDKYDETLDDHAARLAALEAAPGKRWEVVTNYAITGAAGLLLGLLASHVGF